jgi:hypothetical protein
VHWVHHRIFVPEEEIKIESYICEEFVKPGCLFTDSDLKRVVLSRYEIKYGNSENLPNFTHRSDTSRISKDVTDSRLAADRSKESKDLADQLGIALSFIPAGCIDMFQSLDGLVFGALKLTAWKMFHDEPGRDPQMQVTKAMSCTIAH